MKFNNSIRQAAYKRVLIYAKRKNPNIKKIRAACSLFVKSEHIKISGKLTDTIIKAYKQKHPALISITIPTKHRILKNKIITFYETKEWIAVKSKILKRYGLKCMKCSAEKCELHVDHIKPRSLFPELELCEDNLQVLCKDCNMEKSNKDFTDYRTAFDRFIVVTNF